VPTFHIAEPGCLVSEDEIRHRPVPPTSSKNPVPEALASGWLPQGPLAVGLTAGASTPNNIIGEVVERLTALAASAAAGA
jgi:4-hydroxy-3-methylbut-2-enyl diphosphate reductase